MSDFQRIIKYCAIAFAVFIVFSIFSLISGGFIAIGNIFNDDKVTDLSNIDISSDVSVLNIDVSNVDVKIINSNIFAAETNNKYLIVKQENNKLYITQDGYKNFKKDKSDLIVYVPNDMIFDSVFLSFGAGKLEIESLSTNNLFFEVGAGSVNMNNLNVFTKAEIQGGVGKINVSNGTINNLNLDLGVGQFIVNSKITGNSKIEAGIGEVNLNLIGSLNDYKIELDKGLGSSYLDSNDMKEDVTYGSGSNFIAIEGGIGSIKVKFIEG